MNNLVKLIKESTGLSISKFCDQELETKYVSFNLRMAQARLYPSEIFYIVYRTKKPIQELFGQSWQELLINTQGGAIAEKVREIIKTMTEEEKNQISELMGIAPTNQLPAKKKEVEEEPAPEPEQKKEEEKSNENPLDKLFIPTY
jgi:hypothetical protein